MHACMHACMYVCICMCVCVCVCVCVCACVRACVRACVWIFPALCPRYLARFPSGRLNVFPRGCAIVGFSKVAAKQINRPGGRELGGTDTQVLERNGFNCTSLPSPEDMSQRREWSGDEDSAPVEV